MAGPPNRRLLAVATVSLVGLLVVGTLAFAATNGDVAQQSQPETDNTVTRIELSENASARWTVQIRTRLDTERRVEEYTAFQTRFRNDTDQYLDPFRDRIRGVVENAENATGRGMRARNFTATTTIQEVPRRWGVVTYEFTWQNFAARTNGALVVGDVFEGGFFIAANDTLQIAAPADFSVSGVEPEPDEREDKVLTWIGREDFADNRPSVVVKPVTEQKQSTDRTSGALLWALGAGLLVLVAAGVAMWIRSERDSDERARPEPVESETSGSGGTGSSVMTDEERVLELLEANDGRIRQTAIGEEFDWSASKTSRLIGGMAEEGTVEKLRIGRENIVAIDSEE